MKTRFLSLGLAATVIVASAAAFALQAYTIKRSPKEGEEFVYLVKGELDAGVATFTMTGDLHEKVVKVEPNGTYHLEQKQSNMKIKMGDQEIDTGSEGEAAHVTVLAPTGEVMSIKGSAVEANSYRMENLNAFFPPEKPVSIGDTWSKDLKANVELGTVPVKAEYKVLGEEKLGAFDTLKIKYTVKETEGQTPASADGTVWLNKADWTMVKGEAKWKDAPAPGAPMPINGTIVITRVK